MSSLEAFLSKRLRLKVNRAKSAVARPWQRKFLGFTVTPTYRRPRLKPAAESVKRLKAKVTPILRSGRGRHLAQVARTLRPILRGWMGYYRIAEVENVFLTLDQWISRKLRAIIWRQWKRPRTRLRKLLDLGLPPDQASAAAGNGHGPWWNAGMAHMNLAIPNAMLTNRGLVTLLEEYRGFQNSSRTAGCRTARPVV